jgi:hypothetical protein
MWLRFINFSSSSDRSTFEHYENISLSDNVYKWIYVNVFTMLLTDNFEAVYELKHTVYVLHTTVDRKKNT